MYCTSILLKWCIRTHLTCFSSAVEKGQIIKENRTALLLVPPNRFPGLAPLEEAQTESGTNGGFTKGCKMLPPTQAGAAPSIIAGFISKQIGLLVNRRSVH